MNEAEELAMAGYHKVYDYTQYSHDNHVNIIPEEDFKHLVRDTFKVLADNLRRTYGPYGSQMIISEQSQTMTSKDGFNAFQSLGFSHTYKRIVYLAIQDIIKRVNRNVGDGTTTCILLAEKIFNNIDKIIKTPDDKRLLLETLTKIEKDFQDSSKIKRDIDAGIIKKLDKESLFKIILMAGNYDEELAKVVYDALDPVIKDGYVVDVRSVVPAPEVSLEAESNAVYDINYLPGDYRAPVHMIDVNDAITLTKETSMRVIVYDHSFNSADWAKLKTTWDGNDLMIIARTFAKGFLEEDFFSYAKERVMGGKLGQCDGKTHLYLCQMKGESVQNELRDLAEILNTKVYGMYDGEPDFETIKPVTLQIYRGDCLCLFGVDKQDHVEYIRKLEYEIENDKSNSYVKQKEIKRRIKSINLGKEAMLTVKCGTQLEAKLITDKIVDCISIVESAIASGTVPNILNYAYNRLHEITGDELETAASVAIRDSVVGLFQDIYESKYGKEYDVSEMESRQAEFYSQNTMSYDIITDKFVPMTERPTSTQYDLEVVVAALSIVKYLLSGGALIFDAHLLTNINDEGRYIR